MDPAVPSSSARGYPCASCGSQLTYAPGTRALRCVSCGNRQPLELKPPATWTTPLRQALATGQGETPPTTPQDRQTLRCDDCGATLEVPADMVSARCDYCASHHMVPQAPAPGVLQPGSVVPLELDERAARARFQTWLAGLWFRPDALRREHTVSQLHAIYTPYWLLDARVDASFTAERGDAYWDDESVQEGGRTTTRRVRKIRWRRVHGTRQDAFERIQVCASAPLRARLPGLVDGMGALPREALCAYEPAVFAGYRAQRYSVELEEGWKLAWERMLDEVKRRCSSDVGGDEQRFLDVTATPSQEAFHLTLIPLYVLAYRYRAKVYNVVVHGLTGQVQGQAPWSVPKLAALGVTVVALLWALWWWFTHHR